MTARIIGQPTAGATAPTEVLAQAIDDFQQGEGRWAYVQTVSEFNRKGTLKSVEKIKFDPSLPWDDRKVLLMVDGIPATERQQQSFQRDREKTRLKLERREGKHDRLRDRLDLASATIIETSELELRYRVALLTQSDDDFPAEKLETFITLGQEDRQLRRVEVRLRESFRKAGVVKLKQFEMTVEFGRDAANEHPPALKSLDASAVASVVLIPVGGSAKITFQEHRWVKPYDERFEVQMGDATVMGF